MAQCPNCGAEQPEGAKFCNQCGSKFQLTCGNCSAALPQGSKFCNNCGTPSSVGGQKQTQQPAAQTPYGFSAAGVPVPSPSPGSDLPVTPGRYQDLDLLKVGDTLGQFMIENRLGAGGFGVVYSAFDTQLDEPCALKVVPGWGISQLAVKQLGHEWKLRQQLHDYTHVLRADRPLAVDHKGMDLVLLPMEYADGGSLRTWMKDHPDTDERAEEAFEIFEQICKGVSAIHKAGLVHLDLKPGNILFVDNVVKVADLGLSRAQLKMQTAAPELLQDGVGTPAYMAPEQVLAARPEDVDHKADIWALGIILYELLDGQPPFAGTPESIKKKIRDESISPSWKRISKKYKSSIKACLKRDPDKRISGATDIQDWFSKSKKSSEKEIRKPRAMEKSSHKVDEKSTDSLSFADNYDNQMDQETEQLISAVNSPYNTSQEFSYPPEFEEFVADLRSAGDPIFLAVSRDKDQEKARRLIEMRQNTNYYHYLLTAYYWKVILNDEGKTKSSISTAEMLATDTGDWLEIAQGWIMLLKNEQNARKSLQHGERLADDQLDWEELAEFWIELKDFKKAAYCKLREKLCG